MGIEVDIKKKLGDFELNISFSAENEFIALWGPSGVGKTLTLKCIAGIETPDSGKIIIGDRVVFDSDKKINIRPQERNAGLLFQDYALFPNMTVKKNIEIVSRNEADIKVYIDKFKLKGLEELYPHQLSGGQKQRLAMARMLATAPDLIMLDEPFNALDSDLKKELKPEIKEMVERVNKPAIIVSHDEEEVNYFTSKIIRLKNNRE